MLPLTHGRRRTAELVTESVSARHVDVRVQTRGAVPRATVDAVTRQLRWAVPRLPERVLHTRVKLTTFTDPGVTWPAVGQLNLHLPDRMLRAQVAAATPAELAVLLPARLHTRFKDLTPRAGGRPRHWSAQLNHLTDTVPGPGERMVLRRKKCWLDRLTAAEAIAVMEDRDYDVHLFVERSTGRDAVVYRAGDAYRLAFDEPPLRPPDVADAPVTISRRYPPTLTVAGAKSHIEAFGLPFLYFIEASGGRGAVLYHRYDGHFGLITAIA